MTKREITDMQIENLIYKLNQMAQQRKDCLDRLWTLETENENLRMKLMGLINDRARQ